VGYRPNARTIFAGYSHPAAGLLQLLQKLQKEFRIGMIPVQPLQVQIQHPGDEKDTDPDKNK
jgi:hypothetical protein